LAVWFSGGAQSSAMEYQQVRENCPLAWRQKFHQVAFDFFRLFIVFRVDEFQPIAEPDYMRVHDDALAFSKGGAQNDVGGLASYAREGQQFVHRLGHLPSELLDEQSGGLSYIASLVAIKSRRADIFLELFLRHLGVVPGGAIFREEWLGNDIDPFRAFVICPARFLRFATDSLGMSLLCLQPILAHAYVYF